MEYVVCIDRNIIAKSKEKKKGEELFQRLQNIESCYTTTYNCYKPEINQIDSLQTDV